MNGVVAAIDGAVAQRRAYRRRRHDRRGVAFFDGVFIGAPIAVLAASFRPSLVYILATVVVVFLVIGCCRWVDRRWDDWFSGNGTRSKAGSRRCGRAV